MTYISASGGVSDGSKGDITVTSSGASWTLDAVVNSTKMTATGWGETKYLRGDETWQTIAGGGDVVGPDASTDNAVARFDTTTGKLLQNSGVTIDDEGTLAPYAGSTNYPPIDMASGVVTSTAIAGAVEYDGKVSYFSHATASRGVNIVEQFIDTTNAYTIPTAGLGLRQMFGTPTNGAITLQSSTMYMYECVGVLSSLSATSGTFSFGFLGTAGVSSLRYLAISNKAVVTPVAALLTNVTTSASTALVAANLITTAQFRLHGQLHVDTGGTLIPAIGNSVEARPIVGVGSYFRIWPVGVDTVQSVGNWT